MEPQVLLKDTKDLVSQDFEIQWEEAFLTEEQLLEALSKHVHDMLEYRLETLMSTLYRLDVPEKKVAYALSPAAPNPGHIGIAQLIIDRQKQRILTKRKYKQEDRDWFDF